MAPDMPRNSAQASTAAPSTAPPSAFPPGASVAQVGTFSSLRIHNFRIFAASQVVSNSGAWTQRVAQDWLVLTLTGSPAAVGVTTALQFAPSILFSMMGGLAADRFDKRRVLLVTQITMGVCSAILAALCLWGTVQYWHVLVLATATGIAAAFDNPTRQAFVHEMVGARHVSNAVSINSAVFQLGALIGPAVSAVLIAVIGIGYAFAANAVSFAGVVIALMAMDKAKLFRVAAPARQRGQVRSALAEIQRRPELRWPIILAGVCGFVTANFPVILVAFVKEMSFGPAGYGLLTCSLAAGSLLGALVSARRPHTRLRHLTGLALTISAVLFLTALMPGTTMLCIALFVTGAACMPFGITANSSIQLAARDAMRGRVMGVYMVAVLGAAGVGGPALGYLVEAIGARGGLAVGGLLIAAVTSYAMARLSRMSGISPSRIVRSAWFEHRNHAELRRNHASLRRNQTGLHRTTNPADSGGGGKSVARLHSVPRHSYPRRRSREPLIPSSTSIAVPVVDPDSGDARWQIAAATSSALTFRLRPWLAWVPAPLSCSPSTELDSAIPQSHRWSRH